jgi:CRISPR-associated protein Csm1
MNQDLEQRSQLALAVYARAAAEIAQRAGAKVAPLSDSFDALVNRAQQLALPAPPEAARTPGLPALTSLVGHLYGQPRNGYYRPRVLGGDAQTVMPEDTRPQDLAEAYAEIWRTFVAGEQRLPPAASANAYVREIGYHALLQRCAWAMPAPGAGDSDIALFDFARVSAALAVCLAELPEARPAGAGAPIACLIGGDVSGVQDWLYNIGSSGAAKSLRGRSVYLQLLSEIIALYVLDKLALPSCHLLYVGGGNFYVLAPATAAARLADLQRDITARLLAIHGGALYLALGAAPVTETDLTAGRTGELWGQVNRVVNARKRQRFGELDDTQMSEAIGSALAGSGKLEDNCAICRRAILPGERARDLEDTDTAGARRCELCESFNTLGTLLPKAEFLAVAKLAGGSVLPQHQLANWQEGLAAFGYDVQFLANASNSTAAWRTSAAGGVVRIYYWRSADERDFPGLLDPRTTLWIYRPLAQAAPVRWRERGQPVITFDELKSEGIARWGVLRMDVDNLGRIFQEGLAPSNLSRVVGLSAQLRLLFESHVPLLLEEYNAAHPESTYLMYAGGDDLFVVGGWSHLPILAAKVRDALVRFAMHNPKVTISGGISLALDANYPVYQAARAAGHAEELAKDAGRNRLTFLGQAIPWHAEDGIAYGAVYQRVRQIAGWLGHDVYDANGDAASDTRGNGEGANAEEVNGGAGRGKKLNRSFLMRLRAIDAEARMWQKRERKTPRYRHGDRRLFLGPWQWHLVYSLHRAVERGYSEQMRREIDQLVNAIIADEIEVLGLEARWVELLTRNEEA